MIYITIIIGDHSCIDIDACASNQERRGDYVQTLDVKSLSMMQRSNKS